MALALVIPGGAIPVLSEGTGRGLARPQAIGAAVPQGERPPPKPAVTRADAGSTDRKSPSEDEKAIGAVDESFARDYNKGDSKALAAAFTEDAEVVEAEGDRYQGRDLIQQRFAETFAASPGVKIAIEIGSIRFLSPDVAKEEGHTIIIQIGRAHV